MLVHNMRLFLTIVEKGSLVAAARETGLSSTTVSERLASLEQYFGVVLINRTTRSISLTEEGRTLVEGAKQVLAELEELESRIRHGAQTLSGPIRISVPIDLGRGVVSQVMANFARENPDVSLELSLSDGFTDIVGQGFDLAVRFGQVLDSSLRIRQLGSFRRIVCAAPTYLERHGVPGTPTELAQHNCLVMRFGAALDNVWSFGPEDAPQQVTVKGNRIANDGSLVRQWAVEGHGICLKSELDVQEDLEQGRLVPLLEDVAAPPKPLQLMFPPARDQPRRVKAFAEALCQELSVREQAVTAYRAGRENR